MLKECSAMNGIFSRVAAAVIAPVFLLLGGSDALGSPMYSVTDLGKLGTVVINDLNDSGQAVGVMAPPPGSARRYAFVYDGDPAGTVTPLGGSSDPTNYPAVRDSVPLAINNNGQVLAIDQTGGVTGTRNGSFVYANGQIATLPGSATAINDRGQVTGYTGNPSTGDPNSPFNPRAYLYDLARMTLQRLTNAGAAPTEAQAVNNAGQVAGTVITLIGPTTVSGHPFLFSGGGLTDMGTLGGGTGYPAAIGAINAQGDVVGGAETADGHWHAFLYSKGSMKDLGVLSGTITSDAVSINNLGQIVGNSSGGLPYAYLPFLLSNGLMTNLNDLIVPNSGWNVIQANKINNRGQILALGESSQGLENLVLTPAGLPRPGDAVYPTIIPEPSTWMLFGAIGAGLLIRQGRRHPILAPKRSA
jgi:probable HAF family extracellular repeat protein